MDVDSMGLSPEEEQANEVIAAFLAAQEAGERPDLDEWLRQHPELADELASFIAAKASFEEQAGPLIPTGGWAPAADAPPLPAGETRDFGEYVLLHEIARGGMGVVYRAWQRGLDRTVAVKMIRAGQLASAEDVRRFRAEAELAANLDHPHIVPIYEVGQHQGQHFFSMKLIEGGSLAEALAERFQKAPAASSKEQQRQAAQLLATVTRAVHHAHQRGLLHRDLKPGNILLDEQGRPHVSDFGLAKRVTGSAGMVAESAHLTRSHAVVGTASYMAPEQAAGRSRQLTTAADVWSLGAILYEMLTGRPPFRGENVLATLRDVQERDPTRPGSVVRELDGDLETICLKCLEKDPARRYGSAEALAEDLERWLAGEPIRARPASRVERLAKWARRRPAVAALTALVVLVGLLGIAGMAWQWQDARDQGEKAWLAKLAADDQTTEARKAKEAADKARKAEAEAKRVAVKDRDLTAQALRRAEGLHLTAQASILLPTDPGLALLLAMEGTKRAPGLLANNTLRAALDACHEERSLLLSMTAVPGGMPVAFSADGRRALVADGCNLPDHLFESNSPAPPQDESIQFKPCSCVEVWDLQTGKLICRLPGPGRWPLRAALSPDGRLVVIYPNGNQVLDYSTGPGTARQINWYTDRVARVLEVDTGKQIAVLRGHSSRINSAVFSADSRRLVTASWDGTARVWDALTGKELAVCKGHRFGVRWAGPSPDGKTVLTFPVNDSRRYEYPDFAIANRPPTPGVTFAVDPPELLGIDADWCAAKKANWGRTDQHNSGGFWEYEGPGRVWDAATGKCLATLGQPFALVNAGLRLDAVAGQFTPDSRQVILTFHGTRVKAKVWQARTGKLVQTERDPEPLPNVATVGVSPDGKTLLTIADRVAYLDRLELKPKQDETTADNSPPPGPRPLVLRGHTGRIVHASFSPDGRRVLTTAEDKTIRVWDVATGAEELVLRGHTLTVTAASFSPDGRQIFSVGQDETRRAWRVQPEPAHVRVLQPALTGEDAEFTLPRYVGQTWEPVHSIIALDVSPDGRRLVTLTKLGVARIWDVPTGRLIATYRRPLLKELKGRLNWDQAQGIVQFSPDGKRILYLVREQHIKLQKVANGPYVELPYTPVRLLDAATGKELLALPAQEYDVASATFSPDGKWVLVADEVQPMPGTTLIGLHGGGGESRAPKSVPAVRLHDSVTGKVVSRLPPEGLPTPAPTPLAYFSPDSRRVVTSSASVVVWSVPDGRKLRELVAQVQLPNPSGKGLPRLTTNLPGAGPIVFTSDGKKVLVVGPARLVDFNDRKLWMLGPPRLVDASSGKTLVRFDGLDQPALTDLAFLRLSPDGTRLVAVRDGTTLGIWDTATGKRVGELHGQFRQLQKVRFSPDCNLIVTFTHDHMARIWDAATGKELHTLRGHEGPVTFAAFTYDSRRLVTGSADGTARVWELDLMEVAQFRKPRELTPEERDTYEVRYSGPASFKRPAQPTPGPSDKAVRLHTGSQMVVLRVTDSVAGVDGKGADRVIVLPAQTVTTQMTFAFDWGQCDLSLPPVPAGMPLLKRRLDLELWNVREDGKCVLHQAVPDVRLPWTNQRSLPRGGLCYWASEEFGQVHVTCGWVFP
jgi:WD40 repeat protein/tRNA A-37 threonylcarbamoyl transferase component Bud32